MRQLYLPEGELKDVYIFLMSKAVLRGELIAKYSDFKEFSTNHKKRRELITLLQVHTPSLIKFKDTKDLEVIYKLKAYIVDGSDLIETDLDCVRNSEIGKAKKVMES